MKPYDTIEELLEDSKKHGPYVQNKYNNDYYLVTQIYPIYIENKVDFRVVLNSNQYNSLSPLELFEIFTWQDDYLCGKPIGS